MELLIKNGGEFVQNFINGLSRISDAGVVKLQDQKFSCITSNADNTIFVSSQYTDVNMNSSTGINLNVPDFKKLHKLLALLPEEFTLQVATNNISYNSKDIRFKYHLFDEGVISSPAINVNKLTSIPFACKFQLPIEISRA